MADGQGPARARFDWADPFALAEQLTEDERMIAESAASFAADKLAPRVRRAYAEETVDPEIFAEMGEMGLLGVTIPEEHGGPRRLLRLPTASVCARRSMRHRFWGYRCV